MPSPLELESTLTDRYQTTVPETVRRALKLGKRDKIHYAIQPDGRVLITRAAGEDDPVLGQFLGFLARDMASHPAHVQALNAGLMARVQSLTSSVEIDLDAPLTADGE